jgi:hypothetical protein
MAAKEKTGNGILTVWQVPPVHNQSHVISPRIDFRANSPPGAVSYRSESTTRDVN